MTTQVPQKSNLQSLFLLDLSVSHRFGTHSGVRHHQSLFKNTVCVYRRFMKPLASETIVLITLEKLYCHSNVSFKRNKLTYLTPVSCWEKLLLINQILVYSSFASLINIVFTCISKKHKDFSLKIITWFTSRTGNSRKWQITVSCVTIMLQEVT